MSGSSEEADFPRSGRLLGLDYGTRRVGLAVCNDEQTVATPLSTYTRLGPRADAEYLNSVIKDYRIVGIVVGLPIHVGGEEGQKAQEARDFGRWVGEVTGLPVRFFDERYTTALAEEHLLAADLTHKQRKARRDKLAAQIMLQSYLEQRRTMNDER